jgi:aspartate racemase
MRIPPRSAARIDAGVSDITLRVSDRRRALDVPSREPQPSEVQQKIPGLIGMATPTNGAYLHALQCSKTRSETGHRELYRLRSVLYELDFSELVRNVRARQWPEAEAQIAQAAVAVKAAGAEFLVITSNTGITLAQAAAAETHLPILDIVQPTLATVLGAGRRSAGVLSTMRTLESNVFQNGARSVGLAIVSPPAPMIQAVEEIIFDELVFGDVTPRGLNTIVQACDWLADRGADAVILGCTDMTHLAEQLRVRTSLFVADTTTIHAAAAAQVAWSGVMEWTS